MFVLLVGLCVSLCCSVVPVRCCDDVSFLTVGDKLGMMINCTKIAYDSIESVSHMTISLMSIMIIFSLRFER